LSVPPIAVTVVGVPLLIYDAAMVIPGTIDSFIKSVVNVLVPAMKVAA
jgi:hypothetical protein